MKLKQQIIRSVILIAVAVAIGWYAVSRPVGASAPVATVNGESITRGQLTALESQFAAQRGLSATSTQAQNQFQSNALDTLISQTLIEQAARRAGVTASSTEIDAQIASARASFKTQDEYAKALAAHGMTESDLRAQITRDSILNVYLDQQLSLATATATDAEIKTLYDQLASQQASTSTPPLSQVRAQVAQMIVKQKQQQSIATFVSQLRESANIKILISTSTPAA